MGCPCTSHPQGLSGILFSLFINVDYLLLCYDGNKLLFFQNLELISGETSSGLESFIKEGLVPKFYQKIRILLSFL
jgi:hypothetical protein